jgi:hypothetical protein
MEDQEQVVVLRILTNPVTMEKDVQALVVS